MENNSKLIDNLNDADWNFPVGILPMLSDYERSFVELEFGNKRKLQDYIDRINYLGLNQQGKILDAGCGMGQWTLAFAKLNEFVSSIDISSSRIMVANELMKANGINNVNIQYAPIEKIPYNNDTFDAVFCYSVIMFTNIPKTLSEFYRVLKPNGKLYVMTDLWPWYYYMNKSFGTYLSLAKMLKNTVFFKNNNRFFSKKWFLNKVSEAGFKSIESFNDGFGSFNGNKNPNSNTIFYPQDPSKMTVITEILAHKK